MQSTGSTRHHPATRALAAWLLGALVCFPPYLPSARAEVEGEQVRRGKASFHRDGDLTVIRPSDGAIIDYTRFDILRQETVRFEQPNEQSRVLNRVYGKASRIDGTLEANGIVYLVNPAGIFIGKEAVIDVGRLVAAAGDMTNRDFIEGIERFQLTGPIENLGSIEAGAAALLGRTVANHGTIVAPNGVIALVAGDRVVLTRIEGGISIEVDPGAPRAETGIVQTGTVDAGGGTALFAVGDHYSLALNHTGLTRARDIQVKGGDGGTVRIAGTLDASDARDGKKGGRIRVTGDRIELDGATLDASGAAGGGRIRLGGNIRGAGPMENANRTFVDDQSVLRADALDAGDGGSIVIFAEQAAGFLGTISARGGEHGGDGGFAELSSNGRLIDRGEVDLGAPQGNAGTLLYDPQDIRILGGTGEGDDGNSDPDQVANSILFGDEESGAAPFDIFESEIEGTDANIVLEARNSIRAEGSFDHEANSEGVGVLLIRSGNDFTLRTANDDDDASGSTSPVIGIDLTGSTQGTDLEVRTGGDGIISMTTGVQWEAASPEAAIAVGKLTTTGGNVTLRTADGSIASNTIDASGADGATGGNGGFIAVDAGDDDGSNETTVVTGDLISRGGNGSAGRGGNSGSVDVQTRGKPRPSGPPPVATGGGPITIGDIDMRGGNGNGAGGGGGFGGVVAIEARVRGDVFIGDIDTRGGNGNDPSGISNGGGGGNVVIDTDNGDIRVADVNTSGGSTDGTQLPDPPSNPDADVFPREFGGNSGFITWNAGRGNELSGTIDDPHGDILLAGTITSLGGGAGAPENVNGEGFAVPITLTARDSIENDGNAGPHIVTTGFVTLDASEIGADGAIEIDGGDQMDPNGRLINILEVRADERASVSVPVAGFEVIQVTSRDADNDIDVVQGGDEIRVDGDTINRIDTRDEHTQVAVFLRDNLTGNDDVDMDLHVPTDSIDAGSVLELHGEDDVVLDGGGVAIQAHEDPFTADAEEGTPATNADIVLFAGEDFVQGFQTGALRGDGVIDRQGTNSLDAGRLLLRAAEGIGTQAAPIQMSGGGVVAASNGNTLAGNDDGGIFLRNLSDGTADTLTVTQVGNLVGARVTSGNGDIEIENQGGDLRIEQVVRTSGDPDGNGGDVVLGASGGGEIELGVPAGPAVDAQGDITFDGDVQLRAANSIVANRRDGAGVTFDGTIDSDPDLNTPTQSFVLGLQVDTSGTTTLAGDVGATQDLSDFEVGGGLAVTGTRTVEVTDEFDVGGSIRSASGDDGASLVVRSGREVRIGGDVGVGTGARLSGFTVEQNTTPPFPQPLGVPTIRFDGTTAQSVVTGAGGIALNAVTGRPDVSQVATIGKSGGDLTLDSDGLIDIGQNEKLTVQGVATIDSATGVRIGDVSALELTVTSPDTQVRARAAGKVLLKNGARARDFGTDIIASRVTFNGGPVGVTGSGATPRIGAERIGGTADLSALETTGFENLDAGRLERGDTLLDLAITNPDPGHETPLRGPVISGIVPPRTTDEAGHPPAISAEETLAWLRCDADPQHGSDCPQAAPGSALDTPRGLELAQRSQGWLGRSDDARARRAAVARLEPQALHQLAAYLTEVRLLGLSDAEYQAVRDALYAELLADAGSDAPAPAVLAESVQAQAPDIPL